MAEAKSRLALKEVRASVKRMQTEGERLMNRIRHDAQALAQRGRKQTLNGFLTDARKLQDDLRKRAERTLKDLDERRAGIVASLDEQVTRLAEAVVKRLNVARQDDLAELRRRVDELERRLNGLSKERAA
jgi:polyhydroxyalkanoate synthesis regulator phasin